MMKPSHERGHALEGGFLFYASFAVIGLSQGAMRTAATLSSGILATGSRAGLVSTLVGLSAKWKVMLTTPGGDTVVTLALASTWPRREVTLTIWPSATPSFRASAGVIFPHFSLPVF